MLGRRFPFFSLKDDTALLLVYLFGDKAVMEFFDTTTRNLLAVEAVAGVKHHVALSVVGTDRLLQGGYFRAKMAQETQIATSPIPYTIVRATQFFEFVGSIAYIATEGQNVRLPSAITQPIAADDVALALVDFALAVPVNGIVEWAGPELFEELQGIITEKEYNFLSRGRHG